MVLCFFWCVKYMVYLRIISAFLACIHTSAVHFLVFLNVFMKLIGQLVHIMISIFVIFLIRF